MEDILKSYFETVYREYKSYENFYREIAPKAKEDRESLTQFALDNKGDSELVADKLYEVQTVPELYKSDLLNLQRRLLETYKTVKDVIEIPVEIKKEVENFISPKQIYIIDAGQPKEIDPDYTIKLKEEAKKQFKITIEQFFKTEK